MRRFVTSVVIVFLSLCLPFPFPPGDERSCHGTQKAAPADGGSCLCSRSLQPFSNLWRSRWSSVGLLCHAFVGLLLLFLCATLALDSIEALAVDTYDSTL